MNSIRRRLTRNLLLGIYLLFGAGLLTIYLATREELMDSFDAAMKAKAAALCALSRKTAEGLQVEGAERFSQNFEHSRSLDFIEIWDSAGKAIWRSAELGPADLPRRYTASRRDRHWNLTLPNGRYGRALLVDFKLKVAGGGEEKYFLVVAMDREELDETLDLLAVVVAGCGVLLTVATLLIIPPVLRRGLLPLKILGDQAAKIDARSLESRFPSAGVPEELQPICERLNELLSRLEQSFQRERRFSADLAHELRTPLAELRSISECALKWPDSRDPGTDREVLGIARQMESIVTRMLALTRGEQGQLAVESRELELSDFVALTWKPFEARAHERGLGVSRVLPPARAPADEVLLRSILNNLFDNAVAYAEEGGELEIKLEADSSGVAITVANRAEELDSTDLARLFDPFWRKEAARSGEGLHVGLGLSLARNFSRAMGWELSAELDNAKRLIFRLSYRASSEARKPGETQADVSHPAADGPTGR